MDASTVTEIAHQLGIATNNVGELVTHLLPQFIAYEGLGYLQVGVLFEFLMLVVIGGIALAFYRMQKERYDWDREQKGAFKRVVILVIAVFAITIALIQLIGFCRVVAAPEMAVVNYFFGR